MLQKNNYMRFVCIILITLVLANCSSSKKITNDDNWKLAWSEEFNYTGLPDTSKWIYEHGFVRNNENQYYTTARQENIFVHDGVLEIKGLKEDFPNAQYVRGSSNWKTKDSLTHYTSASINSLGKVSWLYGRIEVRAKIPKGMGVWPAIWMLGTNERER